MKKISVFVLAICLACCFAMCGCAQDNSSSSSSSSSYSSSTGSDESQVRSEAKNKAQAHYSVAYDCKSASVTVTDVKKSGSGYTVYGTVSCLDSYNDRYTAKWSMTATKSGNGWSMSNTNYGTPMK